MKTFLLVRQFTAGFAWRQKFSGVLAGMVILGISLSGALVFSQTRVDLGTQTKNIDFSAAAKTLPMKTGTVLPAQCQAGEMFFKTNAAAGNNLYGCVAANTWTKQGGDIAPATAGQAGSVLGTDGTQTSWMALGGDVSGSVGTNSVVKIQGRTVSNAAPASGQTLVWNASSSRWEPQTLSGGGGGGGSVAVQVGSTTVGSQSTINFVDGGGTTIVGSDTGTTIQLQYMSDTAVMQTKAAAQSGSVTYCVPSGASQTAYLCSLTPTLSTYTTGMVLYWQPDVSNAAGATLDVDALGPVPILKADGTAAGAGDAIAGQLYGIWFDGTGFRILAGGVSGGGGGTTLGTLSRVWFPLGNGGGSRDTRLSVTAGRSYWYRFMPDRTRQVRRFAVPLYPWNGTTDTLAIGIYNSSGTKVAECNSRSAGISPSGAMVICSLGAAVTITLDTEYLLAVASETASPQLDCTTDGLAYEIHTLWTAQPGYFPGGKPLMGYGSNAAAGTGTTFALPASLGTETSAAQCAPQVIFLP
jgi:hypothetical protein